jgi:Mn2+/Fe2+ NRAMP family transporter
MLLLINKKELMEEHVNTRSFNFIAWGTTVIMIVLTMVLLWNNLRGGAG